MRAPTESLFKFLAIFIFVVMSGPGLQAQFQRQFGTPLDEYFSKVIQNGSQYYVLGQAELSQNQIPRATVSLINNTGELQWTLSLDIASVWNDAVLTPSGDLLVVGNTLPASSTSGSLMGLVASNGGFTWVRSYDLPEMDGFVRIVNNPVPQNSAFPYYVLGTQTDLMTFNTDMVLLNLNESGTFNWKKLYNGPIFFNGSKIPHDMEAMPNGDLLIAVNFDTQGLIMRTDNSGQGFGGVTTGFPATFTDITRSSDGGIYAVVAGLQNGLHYMMKFDSDLIGISDVNFLGMNEVHQITEGNGEIYVCGSKGPRQTVLKFTENNNAPTLAWIKALDNGIVDQTPSTLTFLLNGQIAYADGRTVPQGGFGELCAILSISDAELTTCMTVDESGVEIVPSGILFESPLLPDVDFYDVPPATNIAASSSLNWQQDEACHTPCVADFSFDFPDCNPTVFFTNLSTSTGPLSYFWDFGYSTGGIPHTSVAANPAITFPAQCNTYNVCLTISGLGCLDTICKPVTINYPQTPVLTCPQNITLDCDADISPAVTGFAILTGACSGATASISFTDAVSGVLPCNGTIIRTWTALDECNVTRSCVQIITIQDNTNPTALCQLPQGYDLDSNCELEVTVGMIDGGSFDNCQLDTIIINPTLIDSCGITQVTLTAIDLCGNINTCTTQIQTIETDPPVINNCSTNLIIVGTVDSAGNCIGNLVANIPTVSDNCDGPYSLINDFTNSNDASGDYPGGSTTITWTATDYCGNITTCDFVVTVICDTTDCCPEFKLIQLEEIRPCDSISCRENSPNRTPIIPGEAKKIACKNSIHSYYVLPNLPGYTYNWSIVGGSLTSAQGNNPGIITWGSGSQGYIEVIVSDSSSTCIDTLALEFCLIDAPTASFSVSPNTTICENQAVTFTNNSTGANTYYWDFDDGTYSTLENPPPHVYSGSGVYTVLLTVTNGVGSSEIPCGCRDTMSVVITVNAGSGPVITSDCKKMLCPGDTSTYCVSPACTSYTWSVNGGTILAMADSCITVVWNSIPPATLPASVSVVTSCPGPCGNSATLEVPVVWNNIPISGPIIVCVGDAGTYSLPVMPGTFYQWIVSGAGGTIVGPSQNTANFNVQWNGPAGPGTVICNYFNPFSGCSGYDTITVDVRSKFMITGPSLICEGDTVTYNTVPFSTSNWNISGGSGFTIIGSTSNVSSLTVVWTTTGSYSITATATPAIYCNLTSTINIGVNPSPIVSLSGPNVICPNQLYDYTASSSLSSGNFTWSFTGNGTATIAPYGPNNSSASVIFSGPGPWTLSVKQTVAGCDGFGTISVTAEPVPTLLNPPVSSCIGGQVTVSVASGNGPFIWSSSPEVTLISAQGGLTASYEIHANGSITVSNCAGPSNAIQVIAAVPQAISISDSGSLCAGNLQLTAPSCGPGTTFQWFGPVSLNTQSIAVSAPGTYSVQVICPNGCISTDTFAVFPVAIPTVTVSTGDPLGYCLPAIPNVLLQAFTLSTGCTYQWYEIVQGLLPLETNDTYHTTTPGTYYVIVMCNGCVDTSNVVKVEQLTCTGGGLPCVGVPNPLSAITADECNPKEFSIIVTNCPGGVVKWNFGDGNTISTNIMPQLHTYSNAGAYLVTATIECNGCTYVEHTNVNVPVVADFDYIVQCGANGNKTITFNNTSNTLGGWNVHTIEWTSTCGSLLNFTGDPYILSITPPCSPMVTMDITVVNGLDTCVDTKIIQLNLQSTVLSIIGNTTVCEGGTNEFTSSLTTDIIQYEWTVNGVAVSQNDTLSYVFDPPPTNQMVGLTVTDDFGCTYTSLITVMVEMARPLTIAPVKICPDCMPPDTLSASPAVGFTNYQWYQNGNLVASTPTYQLCTFNASGNYYVTANDTQNKNCPVVSNTVQVTYLPKPDANIQASSVICVPGSGPYNIALQNTGNPNSNYLYNWSASGATFNPANNHSTTATVNQLGTYQFILTVTDAITGCMAMDTFCVYLYPSPVVSVAVPPGTLCAGTPHTFTASTVPSGNYTYLWSNGLTGPVMTTSVPGYYTVTATSLESGCSDVSNLIYIQYGPSLVLFPMGCDTICDSDSIPIPLALGGPFYSSGYNVQWFVGSTLISTGTTLNLSGLVPSLLSYGNNDIYVIVSFQGCSDTSDVYNIFIEECCECRSEFTMYHGNIEIPVFCRPHTGFIPILPCPAEDVIISGFLGFFKPNSDEPCDETTVHWELTRPDNTTMSGTTTNFTHFIFPKDSVSVSGSYSLSLIAISPDGKDTCVCIVQWVREDCDCCTSPESFSSKVDNNIYIDVDETVCKATVNIGAFSGCDVYIDWIDWDYPNNQQSGPFPPGSFPSHSYTASGTYIICFLAIELDSTSMICNEKLVCDTITLECPNCFCGAFSSMFIPLTRNVNGIQAFCDSTEVILGCPAAGNSIQYTGLFHCAGSNCPATAQVGWELIRLPNTLVAANTTTANPFLVINILPLWYAVPGSYELRLTGHCGLQECPCVFKFIVDCPDPCPCDVEDLETDVAQGFASSIPNFTCRGCFTPLQLNDCDSVAWYLNSISGTLMGSSSGNNTFCYQFAQPGTFDITMVVIRRKSDGSICEVFNYSKTITVVCPFDYECKSFLIRNPEFSEGSVSGGLNSGGQTNGWSAQSGDPLIIEGHPGANDSWSIQLTGNYETADVLILSEPVCIKRQGGLLHVRHKVEHRGDPHENLNDKHIKDWEAKYKLLLNSDADALNCENSNCFELAGINLSPMDTGWYEIEIPVDVSGWESAVDCMESGSEEIEVILAFLVSSPFNDQQGGIENKARIHLDRVCFEGTVSTEDPLNDRRVRIYPNPVSQTIYIELAEAIAGDVQFKMYSLTGQVLFNHHADSSVLFHTINTEQIPPGLYFIEVIQNGSLINVQKIVKQ